MATTQARDGTPTARQASASADRTANARRLGLLGVALVLVALLVFLHVYRLADTPGWDPQEGYNLDIAWNLMHGRFRLFALTSAFAQHPPLFYLQLALAIRMLGYSIVAVRAVAGLYAVATGIALLAVGRRLFGAGPALWAGAAFAVAPLFLANTRWGYTYAQLMFVGVLCLWAAWHYEQAPGWRRLLVAALLAGLAAFSDYEGIAWIMFVTLLALRHSRRDAALALGVGVGIPLVGLAACLVSAPTVFLADAATTFGRAAGGNPLAQMVELLVNYYRFLSLDVWVTVGVLGLFLAPARVRGFLLGAVATLALAVLKVREVGISFHSAVPLLPFLALGVGLALDLGLRRLYGWAIGWLAPLTTRQATHGAPAQAPRLARLGATALVFLVVVSPVGLAAASDTAGLSGALTTRQDSLLATPTDAQAVSRFVLAHAHPGDLVLASPEVAWMFDTPDSGVTRASGADVLQALAQAGHPAAFYPAGLPSSRWAYNVSLGRARYVVVDNLMRQLAQPDQVPALAPLLAQVERWPTVYVAGQYVVYERPGSA